MSPSTNTADFLKNATQSLDGNADSEAARNQSDKLEGRDSIPITRKKRGQAPERAKAILEEVHKLVEAVSCEEVYYHDWLSTQLGQKAMKKLESLLRKPFKCFPWTIQWVPPNPMAKDDEGKDSLSQSQDHHRSERKDSADFLIEKPNTDAVPPQSRSKTPRPSRISYSDGSSCVDGSGAGLILTNPEGMEFTYALRFEFSATNNEAEYEALIAGLRIAARMGVRNLEANVDSRLVANHVLGEYVAKEDNMISNLDKDQVTNPEL
ncbi:reverse transcriptase domain-containing protein [Tanacetum coccineum]|uniref:Reverse transcriptase domain-containing protein n=1 Tax=Tanacetum coccineum TaxID=301880 RepID=A0ABQ5GFY8_9ASTR